MGRWVSLVKSDLTRSNIPFCQKLTKMNARNELKMNIKICTSKTQT